MKHEMELESHLIISGNGRGMYWVCWSCGDDVVDEIATTAEDMMSRMGISRRMIWPNESLSGSADTIERV